MEAFDQLLTCCVCLDRYKNPKLLPCQHSYCMEPCMEGLVDYVKRQVKCPECRAEHRIPYNGIQGFPTNYTLTKFLELHAEITGTVCLSYLIYLLLSIFTSYGAECEYRSIMWLVCKSVPLRGHSLITSARFCLFWPNKYPCLQFH